MLCYHLNLQFATKTQFLVIFYVIDESAASVKSCCKRDEKNNSPWHHQLSPVDISTLNSEQCLTYVS